MLQGPVRLSLLAGVLAFGATGIALALVGAGAPFALASLGAAGAAGLVQYAALRQQRPDREAEAALEAVLKEYRTATATMRHDLRGVMSPALMMSDRLLNHADPAVKRAGQAVVRSIERATDILADNKRTLERPVPPGAERRETTPPAP